MATRIHHLGLTVRPTLRRGGRNAGVAALRREEEQWLDHWLITSGTRIVEFISSDLK